MDDTISPNPGEAEEEDTASKVEFPVPSDSLSVDGVNPEVGDPVSFKVGGTVTQVVNGVCSVKAETVNDQPIRDMPEAEAPLDEMAELGKLAASVDSAGGY